MSVRTEGLAHSVQVRLATHAKAIGVDPNLVLTRYGIERFLYRLSRSSYCDRFVLKGALMMLVWLGESIRPTRDADLLGFGDISEDSLTAIFREVCTLDVAQDGVTFDPVSVRATPIRSGDAYGGIRTTLSGKLAAAKLRVQVDVGIGDIVTPEPAWIDYPGLLDLPRPHLRAYHPETTIAEKFHAMAVLGAINSRMRDFFDIWALATREPFEGHRLTQALVATFDRRRTKLPDHLPIALTRTFSAAPDKQAQWLGFCRKANLRTAPEALTTVVEVIVPFLAPVIVAARRGESLEGSWQAGGPWG